MKLISLEYLMDCLALYEKMVDGATARDTVAKVQRIVRAQPVELNLTKEEITQIRKEDENGFFSRLHREE